MKNFLNMSPNKWRQVETNGGNVHFPMEKSVILAGETTECNGYWDKDTMTLAAAKGQEPDRFLRLLVHEYCHFRQWSEKREAYWNLSICGVKTPTNSKRELAGHKRSDRRERA